MWYLINSQIPITDKCLAFKLSKIIVAEAEKNAIKANFYFLELLEAKIRFLRVGRNSCECICCVTINAIFRNDCERGRRQSIAFLRYFTPNYRHVYWSSKRFVFYQIQDFLLKIRRPAEHNV